MFFDRNIYEMMLLLLLVDVIVARTRSRTECPQIDTVRHV